LRWRPAPHARAFTGEAYVQRRERVEKVVWRGRVYYRAEWQGIARHTPRRVHDAGDAAHCSLWALGRPLETHLAIDADGAVRALPLPPLPPSPVAPFAATLRAGLESVVMAQSAPPLGRALRDVARTVALEWGPVRDDLVVAIPGGLRVSTRLRDAAGTMMRGAATTQARLRLALTLMTDIAALVGDFMRAQAQAHLAALGPEEQAAAFHEATAVTPSAEAIAAAAQALAASRPES
jgi:hypothetical protein